MNEKSDLIDRKGAWIERMFDRVFAAIKENPYATLLVLSVALNFMQYREAKQSFKDWQNDTKALNEKINIAIEKSVERQLGEKMEPIINSNNKLDTALTKMDKTVENFKKKYIK